MAEELTGMALREAVATALGYRPYGQTESIESAALTRPDGTRGPFVLPEDVWVYAPRFESSLDACFAPGGPVERLRSDGWYFGIEVDGDWTAWFQVGEGDSRWSMAPTPAEAVCRAFLAAVNPASSTRHEEE